MKASCAVFSMSSTELKYASKVNQKLAWQSHNKSHFFLGFTSTNISINMTTVFPTCHINRKSSISQSLCGEFGQQYKIQLECGPMPNVMVALPNIGGALCSAPQSLADVHY